MRCNLCGNIDKVPDYYYKGLDTNGIVKDF